MSYKIDLTEEQYKRLFKGIHYVKSSYGEVEDEDFITTIINFAEWYLGEKPAKVFCEVEDCILRKELQCMVSYLIIDKEKKCRSYIKRKEILNEER